MKLAWRAVVMLILDAWDVHLIPEDYSAHDVANALRRFLRSFDDCLLTQRLYDSWVKCSSMYSLFYGLLCLRPNSPTNFSILRIFILDPLFEKKTAILPRA